jgi:hypothetical protein
MEGQLKEDYRLYTFEHQGALHLFKRKIMDDGQPFWSYLDVSVAPNTWMPMVPKWAMRMEKQVKR